MRVLIVGGAGFIGVNSAIRFRELGHDVAIIDNLSRKGSDYNINNVLAAYDCDFRKADIRDYEKLRLAIKELAPFDCLLLLAGQVAVTTSVENPREDFEINAFGALNVLEALRENQMKPFVIYSSTNKVYGKMDDVKVVLDGKRYKYAEKPFGIDESQQLDFHSPYGCSKGCAEQYVRDYSRIYGIPSVVFRQSCIYGEHQFGIEDQGWIAWFTIAAMLGKQITVYGDGNQVRDVLYVSDLVNAYDMAMQREKDVCGKIYNIGGGPKFTLSLIELIGLLHEHLGVAIQPEMDAWRPGDQRVYISDIRQVQNELGWEPSIPVTDGVRELSKWVSNHRQVLEQYVLKVPDSVSNVMSGDPR